MGETAKANGRTICFLQISTADLIFLLLDNAITVLFSAGILVDPYVLTKQVLLQGLDRSLVSELNQHVRLEDYQSRLVGHLHKHERMNTSIG